MFFTKHYLNIKEGDEFYNNKELINNFIDNYMKYYQTNKKEDLEKAVIYSKYYFYYKLKNCIYDDEIMDILMKINN
jgi:Flp pilus assembly CpaF family ATPase